MEHRSVRSSCLIILTVIAVFLILDHAQNVFAPIISALLLGMVMTPLSDLFDKLRLPAALSALIVVGLALSAIVLLLLIIEPYVSEVISSAPAIWDELRATIEEFQRLIRGIEEMSEDMAAAIEPAQGEAEQEPVKLPTVTDALFLAPQFAAQFMIFTGTLYFFLLSRGQIYDWVSASSARLGEPELRHASKQVARYMLTIGAINLGLGVIVAGVMQIIGVPSPILWGFLAFILNFILYLGPITVIASLLITGIVVFDGVMSFVPAGLYFLINATEAQFVTPTLVGKSLAVNPLLVFSSLVFWLWLWGPIGGIIAIPLLIWVITIGGSMMGYTISSGTPGNTRASSAATAAE